MNYFSNFVKNNRPVMIVDDCAVYRTAVKGMLIKLGFSPDSIILASDAQSAKTIARQNDLTMVVCDYNLEDSANGYQLLQDIKTEHLIAADCVLIIITGDSRHHVVAGFAELNPDGYIIKPLNYVTLEKRLPKWVYKKHTLSQVLRDYDAGKFENVVNTDLTHFENSKSLQNEVQFLKAKSFLQMGKLAQAQSTVLPLLSSTLKPKALRLLARIYLQHGDLDKTQRVVDEIKKMPVICTKSLVLQAELAFRQKNIALAHDKVKEAIQRSPKNFYQQFLQAHLFLAELNIEAVFPAIEHLKKSAKYTLNDTTSLSYLHACLMVDSTALTHTKEGFSNAIESAKRLIIETKKRFSGKEFLPYEYLLKARLALINEDKISAENFYEEYCKFNEEFERTDIGFMESLESKKIIQLLTGGSVLDDTIAQYLEIKSSISMPLEKLALCYYHQNWQQISRTKQQKIKQNIKEATDRIKIEDYDVALTLLIDAFKRSPNSSKTANLIIQVLTKAWPLGWSRSQVEQLATWCLNILTKQKTVIPKEMQASIDLMWSQLKPKKFA